MSHIRKPSRTALPRSASLPGGVLALAPFLLLPSCGSDSAASTIPTGSKTTAGGLRIGFTVKPFDTGNGDKLRQGARARISLRVTDEVAGEGLAGLHVGAWLVPRPSKAPAPNDEAVKKMVRKLMASTIGSGASTNLNAYFVVTLNTDRSVAMIDPLLDFVRTKMKNTLQLPGKGADLVFGGGDQMLFVSMPGRGEVAVVDPSTLTILKTPKVGKAPTGLYCQPVTGRVWVSDESSDQAFGLHGESGDLLATLDVGAGRKVFAFDPLGRYAFAAARASGAIVRHTTETGKAEPLVSIGKGIAGMAYSEAAQGLFVLGRESGLVEQIDPETGTRREVCTLPAGCGPMWSDDDGRWVFATEREAHRLHVIDTSGTGAVRVIPTNKLPSQVVFTKGFAHVYCAGSKDTTMIQLSALSDPGAIPVLTIPIGQKASNARDVDTVGEFIATTPDGVSTLILQPEERHIYHYFEGMMAPKGSYQNYGREPICVAVMDRSLKDVGNGVYTVTLPIDYAGTIDLFVYLNQPTQAFAHFEFDVEADPQLMATRKNSEALGMPVPATPTTRVPAGEKTSVRFRLIDPKTREEFSGRQDVRILVHAKKGNWQARFPATATVDGQYTAALTFPAPGEYEFHVQSPSLRLAYTSHRGLKVTATDDVATPVKTQK